MVNNNIPPKVPLKPKNDHLNQIPTIPNYTCYNYIIRKRD